MKKTVFIILVILFTITLTGCYKHYENVTFVDIKFYDLDNNEIAGEYRDYFHRDFLNTSLKLSTTNVIKLNSPAPVINFYFAQVEEGATIKVIMKFRVKNYEIKSLTLVCQNDILVKDNQMEKIEIVEGYTYITYIVENVTKENNFYEVDSWSDGSSSYRFVSRGGNQYIRGFHFILNNSNTDDIL